MSRTVDEQAVRLWVLGVMSTFDTPSHTIAVEYGDQQRSARPALPYATVLKLTETPMGEARRTYEDPGGPGVNEVMNRVYEGTFSVMLFGDGHNEHAIALDISREQEVVIDNNRLNGIVVLEALLGPTRLSTNTNGVTEDRTRYDIRARYNVTRTTLITDTIDSLVTEATFNPDC